MSKIIMYAIVGAVVVAALTHPSGTATAMVGVTSLTTGSLGILSGQDNKGGTTGKVSGQGNYYNFG